MLAFLFVSFSIFPPAYADIYVYVDESGVMHFTNTPTSDRYQLYLQGSIGSYMPDTYDNFIKIASMKYGVSEELLKAIIKVESNFNPRAVSKKGAKGLMQVMPFNFSKLNINDPFDPWQNIMGGTQYFRWMLDRFEGKVRLALAGYNAGPLRVEQHNGIPPIRETRNYVDLVMRYYRGLLSGN